MASLQALSAATQDRKARLAQLKSLKRKAPSSGTDDADASSSHPSTFPPARSPSHSPAPPPAPTDKYLSGRNYDPHTKGARLGFEQAPVGAGGSATLEQRASAIAAEAAAAAAAAEATAATGTEGGEGAAGVAERPLDLFALQPKKPNWDLKRDLQRRLEVLDVRTDNAIARLVRARIAAGRKEEEEEGMRGGEGAAVGMEGATLVEATHVREREDEEEARREKEEEDGLLDGS